MQLDASQLKRLVSGRGPAFPTSSAPPAPPAPEFFLHDTLGSTNDETARLLAAGAPAPLVVIARRQTKGRGRFGRPWLSEPNGNLHISFGFRPRAAPARLQTFTLWAGVNLCDFIAARTPDALPPIGIKWPNDLLFGARKVAGLLTEARTLAGNIDTLVFGLGLNLNPPAAGWPPELAATATSLAEQTGGDVFTAGAEATDAGEAGAANAFAAALIVRVLDAWDHLLADPATTATALAALWQKYDTLRGKTITALSGNERITGLAAGIDDEGGLILKMPGAGARTRKILAGEVTIEKIPPKGIACR